MSSGQLPARVMLVEDEPTVLSVLVDYIQAASYECETISDGLQVVDAVKARPPDLILLDLTLPGRNGLDICRELRQFTDVPIIIVTARVEEIDRLIGLEVGADDYICKPFSPREVVARARALLRRYKSDFSPPTSLGLVIDDQHHTAEYNGNLLDLTRVEFRLLKTLAEPHGRIFSREYLLEKLYADHRVVTDRTVDTHVKNLRRKLLKACPDRDIVRSIYGAGYKLDL